MGFASMDPVTVSIIIPSRDRPAGLLRAIKSLRATQGAHKPEIIVVLDEPDTASQEAMAARDDVQVIVVGPEFLGRPQDKYNVGYQAATGDWIVAFADDCEMISDDWIDLCLAVDKGGFVGLYDGVHHLWSFATLHMASRRYIEEKMDGRLGIPQYHVWWADTEWADRARDNDVFVVCEAARFNHYHPANRTAETDPIYALAGNWREEDERTYTERKKRGWKDA